MKITLFALTILAMAAPAHAYIDPGSGSAIVSAVIGFFVASWLVIKSYWYKIRSMLGLSKEQEEDAAGEDDQQPHDK